MSLLTAIRHAGRAIGVTGLLALLSACGTAGYYAQAVDGQVSLLRARQPIDRLLADPESPPELRARLQGVRQALDWAARELQLPDRGSYRSYVELQRPYVVWNVFAAPEFSLAPLEHCFPVVGCVAYQGYYTEAAARDRARELAADGYDVYVAGISAYSTLGWFDDPVTSAMLRHDDATLIGLIFHELAHQKLFLGGDTAFNESFASFVQAEGLRQYRRAHPGLLADNGAARAHDTEFRALVARARERLSSLYAQRLPEHTRRARKRTIFAELRAAYGRLRKTSWHDDARYDAWFTQGALNNAKLLPYALYDDQLPAFAAMFEQSGRDWTRFYAAAKALSECPAGQRQEALAALRAQGSKL